jgi:hypothetical protein
MECNVMCVLSFPSLSSMTVLVMVRIALFRGE